MPDTINKQSLINLLIDSPLREPIKINLIDIVNNTSEPDLPKVYSTIVKELEIFQKATERRMKLADETIAKLGGNNQDQSTTNTPSSPTPPTPPTSSEPTQPESTPPTPPPTPAPDMTTPTLSVPPLDLPPLPTTTPTETKDNPSTPPPVTQDESTTQEPPIETTPPQPVAQPDAKTPPTLEPLGAPSAANSNADEAALAEIQKELESLKAGVANDASSVNPPAATSQQPIDDPKPPETPTT